MAAMIQESAIPVGAVLESCDVAAPTVRKANHQQWHFEAETEALARYAKLWGISLTKLFLRWSANANVQAFSWNLKTAS